MAKNITLMGADYPDVPAVQLPQTGGGTATFYDTESQILTLSDIFDSLVNDVTGSAAISGNVITIFMQGSGIENASNNTDLGIIKQKYRPKLLTGAYVVTPIYSSNSPYTQVASAWIYAGNGNMKKYGTSGYYISTTYVIEG